MILLESPGDVLGSEVSLCSQTVSMKYGTTSSHEGIIRGSHADHKMGKIVQRVQSIHLACIGVCIVQFEEVQVRVS